jgi:hypothetical protein
MRARTGKWFGQRFQQEGPMYLGTIRFVHLVSIYYTLDFDSDGSKSGLKIEL